MAVVRPFFAVRPRSEFAKAVAALPYDVVSRAEAKAEIIREPLSFLGIDRAETMLSDETGIYEECVYQKAREVYEERIREGVYEKDRETAYYLYELTMDGRVQTGIAGCVSIDEYLDGTIKKHENTREEKEWDRIRHVDALSAQTGPIFLAYRPDKELREITAMAKKEKPVYSFVSEDGIGHQVWKINEKDRMNRIAALFANIPNLYIADGHHRAASAVKVGLKRRKKYPDYTGEEEFNYFLAVIFPADELKILPYNRIVKDLAGWTKEEFLRNVAKNFTVSLADDAIWPERKGEFGLYVEKQWYRLVRKPIDERLTPVEALDVSILQDSLLGPVLKIEDPRVDSRIAFVGGIRGLKELERRADRDFKVAFSMYPTSIEELFGVADAGLLMPPKSTWFEPKLRSGLFIHEFER
ncbi:MAG: DUF1015 domain-containing protein [Lachnospiraceae bacterium]|nr:DUF1015 domain-containing protein [Lachnospiraceae bacterium]